MHITNCIATCLTVYFKSILPQLHAVITPSPLRNGFSTYLQLSGDGFAEAASAALCSLFVRAQQAGLHNPDRERRGYFIRREGGWKHDNVPCVLNTVKALDVEPDAHCRPVLCLKIITRVNCFTSFMFYVSFHLFQCNLLQLFLTLNIQLFCLKFKNQPKIFPGNFYELCFF